MGEPTEKFKLGEEKEEVPIFMHTRKKARYKEPNAEPHGTKRLLFPNAVPVPSTKKMTYYEGSGVMNEAEDMVEYPAQTI